MKSLGLRSAGAPVLLLIGVLLCAFVLEGAQPQHSHTTGQPGLYDAECPLALASFVRTNGWAPSLPSVSAVAVTVALTLSGPPEKLPKRSLAACSSRAPPLA
jgi:hypothetical protein